MVTGEYLTLLTNKNVIANGFFLEYHIPKGWLRLQIKYLGILKILGWSIVVICDPLWLLWIQD